MPRDADSVFIDFDLGAQGFHASERAVAIGGGGEMAQFAGAFGKGGDHGVTMGDRFVAWRLDAARELLRGVNGALFHTLILPCGSRWKNFTTEITEGTEFGRGRKPVLLYSLGSATTRETLKPSGRLFRIIECRRNLDVSTQHGASNSSESGNASWRPFCFHDFPSVFSRSSRAGAASVHARIGRAGAGCRSQQHARHGHERRACE